MWRLLVFAAVLTITAARPETYREKEDFQYSRSSSDEGSKSGYYGAQRGNMGGNYERAHNMDTLAQHQMSGLVRQVEGELGEGANQRTGSVFTSANSRGMYGSGHYDLSHVQGRNFQEGVSYDGSQSQSSLSSHNAGSMGQLHSSVNQGAYDSSNAYNSRHRGYHAARNSNQMLYANNQQHSADDLQLASQQQNTYESHGSGYNSQSGYHRQSAYDQANYDSSNRYGSNVHHRLVGTAMPVRVVVRPGTTVTVPVAAQTYDSSHGSTFDHNAINTEAEALSGQDQHIGFTPSNKAKHYESSYSYRKEWEKHNTQPAGIPLAVPTVNPYPKNSELYEDAQLHNSEVQQKASSVDAHNFDSSHSSSVKSASSLHSRHQSGYNAQHHSTASNADSSALTAGEYNNGAALNQVLNNQVEDLSTKPKSYQSSYSYHKSWERQGDPYIIIPTSNDHTASQKLVTANHGAYGDTRQYGSHYHYGTQHGYVKNGDVECDCDENGHIRVARSYDFGNQQQEDLTQQTQSKWDNIEDLGQRTQNLEDLGQQTQQSWNNLEDLGQHTQNLDLTPRRQSKWDKIEDLGQHANNQWTQQETDRKSNWNTLELEPQKQTDTQYQNEDKQTPMLQVLPIEGTSKPDKSNIEGDNEWGTVYNYDDKEESNNKGEQVSQKVNILTSQQTQSNNFHGYNDYHKQSLNNEQQYNPWIYNEFYNPQSISYDQKWKTYVTENNKSSSINSYSESSSRFSSNDSQPLSSFWNKLDKIEKSNHSEPVDVDYGFHIGVMNIQNSIGSLEQNEKTEITTAPVTTLTIKPTENMEELDETNVINIARPQDIGRGDIETEDTLYIDTTQDRTQYTHPPKSNEKIKPNLNNNYNKNTQTSTETMKSLNINVENANLNKNYANNFKQSQQNEHTSNNENNYFGKHTSHISTTIAPSVNMQNAESANSNGQIFNEGLGGLEQQEENIFKRNDSDLQQNKQINIENFADLKQQNEDVRLEYFEHQVDNSEQQSTNFNQASKNFELIHNDNVQSSDSKTQTINREKHLNNSFEKQSSKVEHIHPSFEQEAPKFRQQSQQFNKQTTSNYEQLSSNIEPQLQSSNFEQQSTNFELQSSNFEEQSTNFEQQSSNFEPQSPNFEQQSTSLGTQSLNFEHQLSNEHAVKNEGQQTNTKEIYPVAFKQQSTNLEQQPPNLDHTPNFRYAPSFGQHSLNSQQYDSSFRQQLPTFEHHSYNDNHKLPNYEHHSSNFEQHLPNYEQHSPNFVQYSSNIGSQSQDYAQHLPNFKQHSLNFEQHSPNLGQYSSNFEQHLPNYGQHSSNFANSAQSSNLEHHSVNSEPHIPSYGQQSVISEQHPANFEQQSDNMEEQAYNFEHQLDNFEQQSGVVEQQSINFEPQNNGFYQESLSSNNKESKNEDIEEKQVSIPIYNTQAHWVRKNDDFEPFSGDLDEQKLAWNGKSNTQQVLREWQPIENLQHSQNIGMFSQIHDMPEKIDQQRSSDSVVPKAVANSDFAPEPVTEKSSFWKSVTNKFSTAKDKVKSWFNK